MDNCDKYFLKKLSQNKVTWDKFAIEAVKRLGSDGYAEYKTAIYAGWWEVTDKGRKYAGL